MPCNSRILFSSARHSLEGPPRRRYGWRPGRSLLPAGASQTAGSAPHRAYAPHATRYCRAVRSLPPCGASLPGSSAYGTEPLREPPHAHSSWDYCRSYASLLHKCEVLSGHFGGRFTIFFELSSAALLAFGLPTDQSTTLRPILTICSFIDHTSSCVVAADRDGALRLS